MMMIVGVINILQGYCASAIFGTFNLSQGSGHVNSMVLNLISCNKEVITPKVEHVHWQCLPP